MFVHRTRTMAVATLALLNVFTLGAGAAVAHMLPPRLAALRIPATAGGPLIAAGAGARARRHIDHRTAGSRRLRPHCPRQPA